MATKANFYSNPAFCQQSEYTGNYPPRVLSPKNVRQSPVGAQCVTQNVEQVGGKGDIQKNVIEENLEEQEFYEEVLVDVNGFITDKKFVVVAQNNEGKKYIQVPQNEDRQGSRYALPQNEDRLASRYALPQNEERLGSRYALPQNEDRQGSRYALTQNEDRLGSRYALPQNEERLGSRYALPQNEDRQGGRYALLQDEDRKGSRYGLPASTKPKITRSQSHRYEFIQMQEQNISPVKRPQYLEDVEVSPGRYHRYAVIATEEETEISPHKNRYALVPVDHLTNLGANQQVVNQKKSKYEYIQPLPTQQIPQPPQSPARYEYIQTTPQKGQNSWNITHQSPRPPNPVATQKLHEILSTPKKIPDQLRSPQSGRKLVTPHISPIAKEYQAKNPQKFRKPPPKAQQKLNYTLGVRQIGQDKRHMAIVTPMCSSPIQSVYSETTYSKSSSWSNLSFRKAPIQATLSFAAFMLVLCGAITSGLCFYMIYLMERQYFLDFGVVAGFTCLILGLLGFRSRNVYWLPNRNYISGYIILSVFSLLTCIALLVLLVKQPKKGTPLADMTSGAVCGFSVLSLVLATMGVVSSYCCKYPPPDNRVQHCAEGFTV